MYDTVILILKKEDIGDKYKWQAILQNIYQTCEYKKVEGGCGYTGGLRVSVTDKRIRIEGSLSKYYYGNNIRSLTLEHTKEALKRLRRELNVPMDKADVCLLYTSGIDVQEAHRPHRTGFPAAYN